DALLQQVAAQNHGGSRQVPHGQGIGPPLLVGPQPLLGNRVDVARVPDLHPGHVVVAAAASVLLGSGPVRSRAAAPSLALWSRLRPFDDADEEPAAIVRPLEAPEVGGAELAPVGTGEAAGEHLRRGAVAGGVA